jgi:hypothetical protein
VRKKERLMIERLEVKMSYVAMKALKEAEIVAKASYYDTKEWQLRNIFCARQLAIIQKVYNLSCQRG